MLDPSSFAYDHQAALALEVLLERKPDGAFVQDIMYASPRGEKSRPTSFILQRSQCKQV